MLIVPWLLAARSTFELFFQHTDETKGRPVGDVRRGKRKGVQAGEAFKSIAIPWIYRELG